MGGRGTAPARRPPGGRITLLGSPRGLTNGGERPALRRAGRAAPARVDLDLTLLGPVVAGLALGVALFLAFGPAAQGSLGATARTALAGAAAAAAGAALWLAWRSNR
ncbi:MAG TPA: hypothetical protein VGB42_08465 [Candidatus Thermoplasmatota archaeon]